MTLNKFIEISTGHRLPNHEGGCYNFHGHNYQVNVFIEYEDNSEYLDGQGFVIDFGDIKKLINQEYDHRFLMWSGDPFREMVNDFPGMRFVPYIPTAENIVLEMVQIIENELKSKQVELIDIKIELNETANSKVIKSLNG